MPIFHFFSDYVTKDPETQMRHMVAKKTWAKQPWTERPIKDETLPRMYTTQNRKTPFVKDIFNKGIEGLAPDDIAVYTNTDICVVTKACAMIADALQAREAMFAYRIDFHHQFMVPIPDADVHKGIQYAGSDLYAFRCRWWAEWGEIFPDLLLGFEGWDPCMRVLMQKTQEGADVELRNIIYHQRHASFWERAENRNRHPAQRHNLALEWHWLSSIGVDPRRFGIRLV